MKPSQSNACKRGFLIVEVLCAMAILMGIMLLLLPAIRDVEMQLTTREQRLQLLALEAFVQDQFTAQFSRLAQYGCLPSLAQVEVGASAHPPDRLSQYPLDTTSDWLKATDFGVCAAYAQVSGLFAQLPTHHCDALAPGDRVSVSTCSERVQGQVLSVTSSHVTVQTELSALSGNALVITETPFYWFVKPGKSGMNAFWRRPALSGNALELSSNVSHVRVYPILDQNEDGIADEITVEYGVVPISKLSGLLVEYQYAQMPCLPSNERFTYQTLRGDVWQYDGVCSHVGKQLIDVRGTR